MKSTYYFAHLTFTHPVYGRSLKESEDSLCELGIKACHTWGTYIFSQLLSHKWGLKNVPLKCNGNKNTL